MIVVTLLVSVVQFLYRFAFFICILSLYYFFWLARDLQLESSILLIVAYFHLRVHDHCLPGTPPSPIAPRRWLTCTQGKPSPQRLIYGWAPAFFFSSLSTCLCITFQHCCVFVIHCAPCRAGFSWQRPLASLRPDCFFPLFPPLAWPSYRPPQALLTVFLFSPHKTFSNGQHSALPLLSFLESNWAPGRRWRERHLWWLLNVLRVMDTRNNRWLKTP